MKVKFLPVILLISAVGLCLTSIPAFAQDKGLSPGEIDLAHFDVTLSEDRGNSPGHDSLMIHSKAPASTATATKAKNPEHKAAATAKEEDNALSFNFLYYIIQKFKISDLVDE